MSAIVSFDSQIVPETGAAGEPTALLSPPFTATAMAAHTSYGTAAGIRLRPGASMAAVPVRRDRTGETVPGHRPEG